MSLIELNGKVVHLVQRAPPSSGNPPPPVRPPRHNHAGPPRPPNVGFNLGEVFSVTRPGPSFNLPLPPPGGSSSLLRLNTARRMLEDASQTINRISVIPPGNEPLFTPNNTVEGSYPSPMPFFQAATSAALAAAFSTVQSMG